MTMPQSALYRLNKTPPELFLKIRGRVKTDKDVAEFFGEDPNAIARYRKRHKLGPSQPDQYRVSAATYKPGKQISEEGIADLYADRTYEDDHRPLADRRL